MKGIVIEVIAKNDEVTYDKFFEKMQQMEISNEFNIFQITQPVHSFRQEFLEHIAEYGLSSIFESNIMMESITAPSMPINEIEKVVATFVAKLQGSKKIIIIDPYFFSKSSKIDVAQLFLSLLSKISSNLEEICFITNGKKNDAREDILSAISPTIKVCHIITDVFHDRYWIDPDSNKGIIMGTSLNGLSNKISLIDLIRPDDVAEIVKLVAIQKNLQYETQNTTQPCSAGRTQ